VAHSKEWLWLILLTCEAKGGKVQGKGGSALEGGAEMPGSDPWHLATNVRLKNSTFERSKWNVLERRYAILLHWMAGKKRGTPLRHSLVFHFSCDRKKEVYAMT